MSARRCWIKSVTWVLWVVWVLCIFCVSEAFAEPLTLLTRSRARAGDDNQEWQILERTVQWEPRKTAIVICDMWNQHWCQGATARVAEMAPRMNEVIQVARKRGVFIIHCPSDTVKYYEETPGRR